MSVETFQTPFEHQQLVSLFWRTLPERVLEIGVWQGGTLRGWLEAPTVVAVDDRMQMAGEWESWADTAGCELHLLRGRSQDIEVIEAAAELGPYGFVFIDADHTYDAVRSDWESYGPMVGEGGIVAFHDIQPRPDYGVSQLWQEIKARPGCRWLEIGETVPDDVSAKHGIGVVFL